MQSFAYDDLYRLTAASGSYQFAPNKVRQYTLQMEYNGIHNILSKQQTDVIVQPSGVGVPQHKTSYEFDYAYGPDGGARPHAPLRIGARTYTYDADGNQTGWTSDVNGTRRSIVWDDENRIQSVADNGHVKSYKYDDTGERIIKTGPQGETVYVNPYFTIRNRSVATKHVFVGTTRMVSKLVYQENRSIGGSPTVPPIEKDLYFYHGDQVGSSNFVTDAKGNLYEHLEYMPFGESWVQESTITQRTPYLFTAKELDEETGLYEIGARSYDPRTSVWQSADPGLPDLVAADAELLRVPRRLAMYTYALQNPVIRTDPDGKDPIDTPLPDVPEYKLTPPSFLVPPTQHISLLPPNALKLTPPTLTPVVTGPLFTVPPPSLTPSLVPPQGTLVPVNPLLPFPPSGSGSSSTGSATTPALPDRLHVFTAGPLDVGGRLGFPSLPDNPTLTEMNRQAAIYTQLATGKVPSGFDAVDKAALAKAVWGIFSTYIAPDFARNLSSSLSRPTPTTGVSYEIDGVLFTDSLGAGISLTLRH